jgi:hypothetical protein
MIVKILLNIVYGCIFLGLGIWELITVISYPAVELNVNDLVMCFIYTISIINIITGIVSIYIFYIQVKDPERSDRYTINISSGISIWGLILYFRYPYILLYPIYHTILLVEMIYFFSRIVILIILVCGSCLKQDEVLPVKNEK